MLHLIRKQNCLKKKQNFLPPDSRRTRVVFLAIKNKTRFTNPIDSFFSELVELGERNDLESWIFVFHLFDFFLFV